MKEVGEKKMSFDLVSLPACVPSYTEIWCKYSLFSLVSLILSVFEFEK